MAESFSSRGMCFGSRRAVPVALLDEAESSPLVGAERAAVARLLPLLGCGEEAASLAFDALAGAHERARDRYALYGIAQEERIHDMWIQAQINRFAPSAPPAPLLKQARHLHLRLGRGRPSERLARIAALDAAVCLLLSRLLRPSRPICRDGVLAATLRRIRNDEARHVSVARDLARDALPLDTLNAIGAETRAAFADVLMLGSAAFDTLGVDPIALDRAVRTLPPGLFGAR